MSPENRYGNNGEGKENFSDSETMLVTSLSGRIIYATPLLKAEFGTEITGKNLNDFLDDKIVSNIISNASSGDSYIFHCLISGKLYKGVSEKEGNSLNVYFSAKQQEGTVAVSKNSLKYLQAEINSVLSVLLGALKTYDDRNDPTAMFARKNVYRLLRVTRNVFDKAACESDSEGFIKQNCDILAICQNVIERIMFPLHGVDVEIEIWHDGGRHVCMCVAEHVERMITNMVSCVLKGNVKKGKYVYLKVEILEKDNGILVSVLAPHKLITENMITGVFLDDCKKEGFPDKEMSQTLQTIKTLAAYNNGSFVMSAEKDGDRLAVLLPKAEKADGLILKSPQAAYNSGTLVPLVELSEILPDSLY